MLNIEQNIVSAISHVLSSLAIVCYSRIEYNLQHVIAFLEIFNATWVWCGARGNLARFAHSLIPLLVNRLKIFFLHWCCEALKHEIINIYFPHWTRTNYICQLKWSAMNGTTGDDTLVYLAIFWLADFFSMNYVRCTNALNCFRICLLDDVIH